MQIRACVTLLGIFLFAAGLTLLTERQSASTKTYPEATTIVAGSPSFDELTSRFTALAQDKGGVYAYAVLAVAKLPPGTLVHLLGHSIGDVLYEQKGVAAIADCTPDFGNACSHAITIGAMGQYGVQALSKIKAACATVAGGVGAYNICNHGAGHGVFAYFGYTFPRTISFCRQLGTGQNNNREFQECIGGAVMELVGGGGHDHDQWVSAQKTYFDPTNPLAPCTTSTIPADAKAICLTYLTPRLFTLAGGPRDGSTPDDAVIAKAFSYCDMLPQSATALRSACYGGFGKEFDSYAGDRDVRLLQEGGYSHAQIKKIDTWCALAGSDAGHAMCTQTAVASLFWGGEYEPSTAFAFCKLVSSAKAQSACYGTLSGAIRTFLKPGPQRNLLCVRLPDDHIEQCEGLNTTGDYASTRSI